MSLDAYSPCLCGTGKKIKFCCPDLLGEFQKIHTMVEGDQLIAALKHIDRVLESHPDRPSLMALKALLLRISEQVEEAEAHARLFVEKHPDNPIALAEMAMITAMLDGGEAAMAPLQRAMTVCDGVIDQRVFEAMRVVAEASLADGQWIPAHALIQLRVAIGGEDSDEMRLLMQLNRSTDVPLVLKNELRPADPADEAPWKPRVEEAMAPLRQGLWQAAADRLAALTDEFADVAEVWERLAVVRGWLADRQGSAEAWRKYAALTSEVEGAAEAEARAMFLSDDPLGDAVELKSMTWTVREVEELQAALSLEKRTMQIPFDPSQIPQRDDSPSPKAAYAVLDQPIPESAEGITLAQLPRMIGRLLLYGRQTDREARLVLAAVATEEQGKAKQCVEQVAADAVEKDPQEETIANVSATRDLFQPRWQPPQDIKPEQLKPLVEEFVEDAVLVKWPELKLGVFDGRSAREVAGDEALRPRLLGAILVVEQMLEEGMGQFDFNRLRSELGLPTLGPIELGESEIEKIPLTRLDRLEVEKLDDDTLLLAFHRAAVFGATSASWRFAEALVERPSLQGSRELLPVYEHLAASATDPDRTLEYIDRGRQLSDSAGESAAGWMLMELPIRLMRGEGHEAGRLVDQLQRRHMQEPGVAQALTSMLVRFGILNPDGTPAARPGPAASTAEAPAEEPGKIWTPDSDQSGGGGKIWTPD